MSLLRVPLISLILACSACGLIPPKQLYKGQERAKEEIAVVHPETGVYATVYTLKKEGKREIPKELGEIENGRTFSLLPGKYKAMVTYNRKIRRYDQHKKKTVVKSTKYSVTPGFMKFAVKAGGKYSLRIKDTGHKKWRPILVDSASGATISKSTKLF